MSTAETHYLVVDAGCECSTCRAWMARFGVDHVAILDPKPETIRGRDGYSARYVRADLDQLTPKQVEQAIRFVATTCGVPVATARKLTFDPEHGLKLALGPGRLVCQNPDTGRAQLRFRRAALDRMEGRPR